MPKALPRNKRYLTELETRLIRRALETGSCDITEKDDLRLWKGWRAAKKNLIAAGLLNNYGNPLELATFALQEGIYEVNKANTTRTVNINPITHAQLKAVMDYLNNSSFNAAMNFCINYTFKNLGLKIDDE